MADSVTESKNVAPTRKSKMVLWKNTLILGFAFCLHLMGVTPIVNVQSSLNSTRGLGTVALSVHTTSGILASMLLATGLIHRIGCKWTMVVGHLSSAAYVAANFHPTWATLVPGTVFGGAGRSLMIIGQATYMNRLTRWYADQKSIDINKVSPRCFGVFFALMGSHQIFGNVVSSFILGLKTVTIDDDFNRTFPNDVQQTCGAQYCNQDLGTDFNWKESRSGGNGTGDFPGSLVDSRRPERYRVYALCGFCLICAVLSALVLALVVDSLPKLGIAEKCGRRQRSTCGLIVATFTSMKDPKQWLLLPLISYNGMDNYFISVDMTKAFITCPLGIQYIGVIMASFGIFGLASSFICGWFNTRRTRWVPFALAFLTHLIPAIVMLIWIPSQDGTIIQYILASSWGVGSGVISAQICGMTCPLYTHYCVMHSLIISTFHLFEAYYGIIFLDNLEAAMSCCHLWNSVAAATLYGVSHLLCVYVKLSLLIAMMIASAIGFAAIEIWMLIQDRRLPKLQAKESLDLAAMKK